ncbi:MAG: DNA-binding transcriptional regulator [Planctomycetia bacterium]|nr:DNA-binding transcriptional regulator [Planctomycetia bacterium]
MMKNISKKEVLLLIETSRSFGRLMVQGVSRFAQLNRNWNYFLFERNMHEEYPEWFNDWDGDGIISRSGVPELSRILVTKGVPVVELMGDGNLFPPHIMVDEHVTGQMAADHFYHQGLRHFGFFSLGHNWWSQARNQYYAMRVQEFGHECLTAHQVEPELNISLPVIWENGAAHDTLRWLESLPKPIGIFCPWDLHAFFLMNVCRQKGILIPEEVAVLAVGNNVDLCQSSQPPLSSIILDGLTFGYEAAVMLDAAMNGTAELPKEPRLVPPCGIDVRQSSRFSPITERKVAQALGYFRDNVSRNPTIREVAREVGLSRCSLNRLFVKNLGKTTKEEFTRVRMEWARELLRDTNMSIVEISRHIDYSSSVSFIRAFRSLFRSTPKEYRNQCQANRHQSKSKRE